MRALLPLATLLLASTTLPATSGATCPQEHQGLGEIHGAGLFGDFSFFVIGDWTDGCERVLGCADSARGSAHALEGFPAGPFEVTELGDTPFGCLVECSFPLFGILYRGPGGGVFPGQDAWGNPIVAFDCPGGFHGEMRQNAF